MICAVEWGNFRYGGTVALLRCALVTAVLLCAVGAARVAATSLGKIIEFTTSRNTNTDGHVAASQCGPVRTRLSYKEGNFFYFSEVTANRVSCATAIRVDDAIIARYCAHSVDDYCGPPFGRETVLGWQCHTLHAVVCTKASAKIVSVVESGGGD